MSCRACAVLVLLVTLSVPDPAAGQVGHRPSLVPIVIAGSTDDAALLASVLLELVHPLPVAPTVVERAAIDPREVVTPVADAAPSLTPLARVWIDLTGPAVCMVYIADTTWERVLVRRVALAGPVDAVTREEIGQIVTGTLEALLAGDEVGVARPEAAALLGVEPEPLPPPAPVSGLWPRRVGVELAVGYEVAPWSTRVGPPHGISTSIGVVLRRVVLRPTVGVLATVRPAVEVDGAVVAARVDEIVVGLFAGIEPVRLRRFGLRLALAAGALVTNVTPSLTRRSAGLALQEDSVVASAAFRAGVELRLRLASSLALGLGAGVEAAVPSARLVVVRSPEDEVVFEPWVARPLAWLFLSGEPL